MDIGHLWSPQGDKIIFGSKRTGKIEIFMMNIDGTKPVQLTDGKDNSGPD